jgi:hypothetical protein
VISLHFHPLTVFAPAKIAVITSTIFIVVPTVLAVDPFKPDIACRQVKAILEYVYLYVWTVAARAVCVAEA